MTAETRWLERLERLHPLLSRRPDSDRAARQAERDYDNDAVTRAGIVAVIIVGALGLWLAFQLIGQSRFDDCLLAHRYGCDRLLQ